MSNVTSQSELTTKEIVEQTIQDYHESILPYLNGMVPTIANKFDKANLYSTDEQIVGRWIDGKPIYQKVYINISLSNSEDNVVDANFSHTLINYDIIPRGITNTLTKFNKYTSENLIVRDGQLIEYFDYTGTWWAGWNTADIIVQYTKTTDDAIEIGSDTDYSLEEKIIGTWIDGKPIYQIVRDTPFPVVSLIPTMSSNTSDVCEVSSIGDYKSNYSYKAFDNNDSTYWSSTTNNYGYLNIHFFTAQTVAKIGLKPRALNTSAVKDFEIWGSNDNFATHDVLLSAVCQNNSDIQSFNLATIGSYSYYRLNVLNVWTTDAMSASVVQLNLFGEGQSDIIILDARISNGKYVYQYTKTTDA